MESSEKRYRKLVEGLPLGLYQRTPGPEGRFTMVNLAMARMLGYEGPGELLSHSLSCLCPDIRNRKACYERIMAEGEIRDKETQITRRDGKKIWVAITARAVKDSQGNIVHVEGSLQDITERKQAEEEKQRLQAQLQQAQKLESIGRLAGGIAHDLNNFLVPIIGYSELLLNSISGKNRAETKYVEHIMKAARRAKKIVRQLLAFSRKQVIEMVPVDMNKVILEFEKLLRSTIREDIDIELALAPSLPTIKADPGQLEQVILNLAVNAQDAMPGGGRLEIRTSTIEIGQSGDIIDHEIKPGRYVLLGVSDNGHGMEEKVKKTIFEPFFTTKPKEQGTGLGLSTVYGIVKQHSGDIKVFSQLGKGTTFEIYLPVSGEVETSKKNKKDVTETSSANETILLVEDDDQVRSLIVSILKRQGYRLIEASNAEKAIEKMEKYTGPLDLLLTDVIMPGMNGKDLYEYLKDRHPMLKVFYISGYSGDVISDHGVLDNGINFLPKPFSANELTAMVRKALMYPA